MLSEEEKTGIQAELARHPARRGALLEALRLVQRRRGWVSPADVVDVAEFLGLPVCQVEEVATFYSMIFRQPVGRHVILLCDSVSCWVTGAGPLLRHVMARLGIGPGHTTADGRFTLLPAACLGACDGAPAMKVDEDLHVELTPEKIDQILTRYA
jgi:NADH-quinone oxidoreductase subunit E